MVNYEGAYIKGEPPQKKVVVGGNIKEYEG